MSLSRSSSPALTTRVSGSADGCVARPAMKMPSTLSTGDPSYFVAASTSGNASPTVLTISKAAVIGCLVGFRLIDAGLHHQATRGSLPSASGIPAFRHRPGLRGEEPYHQCL